MYNRHPFGLSSSSEYFHKRMSQILERLPGIMCLIYGTTQQDYNERLDVVMKKLQTAQLTLNAQKCEFKKRTKQSVGYIIGSNGVQADPQTLSIVGYGITSGRQCRTPNIRSNKGAGEVYALYCGLHQIIRRLVKSEKSVLPGKSAATSIRLD